MVMQFNAGDRDFVAAAQYAGRRDKVLATARAQIINAQIYGAHARQTASDFFFDQWIQAHQHATGAG
ncbi:hypothetical protein D3C76_1479550 [compost metagenome]